MNNSTRAVSAKRNCARFIQLIVVVASLNSILGCAPESGERAANVQGNELTIPVPDFLLSARAIDPSSLRVSVTAVSSTSDEPLQGTESVQTGGDRTFDFTVPYSGAVTLDIVWFHDDLEIARVTQTVPGVTSNTVFDIANSAYNTSADFDEDGSSNLREFTNDTDPRNSASSPALSTRVKKVFFDNLPVGAGATIEFQYDDNGRPSSVLWIAPALVVPKNGNLDTEFRYNQAGQLTEKKRFANPGITALTADDDFSFTDDQLLETHRYTYTGSRLASIQITESQSNDTFRAGFGNYNWVMVADSTGDGNRLGRVDQTRAAAVDGTPASSVQHIGYQYGTNGGLAAILDLINSNTFTVAYDVENRISTINGLFTYRFEYEAGECELMDFNEYAVFFPLCYR